MGQWRTSLGVSRYAMKSRLCELLFFAHCSPKLSIEYSLKKALDICLDAAKGMIYIHSADIIHRDLKSMNIMVTDDMRGKIADYGESREQDTSQTMTSKGTAFWMAPEVGIASRYDSQADVYSFGVVLYEVAKRDLPYKEFGNKMAGFGMAYQVAMKGLRPTIEESWNEGLKALMKDCYEREPSARPTFAQLADRLAIIVEDVAREEQGGVDSGEASVKDEASAASTGATKRSDENLRAIPLWKMIQTDASLFNFGKKLGRVRSLSFPFLSLLFPSFCRLTCSFNSTGRICRGVPVFIHGRRCRCQGVQRH